MKKFLLAMTALLMTISANAFEFDGIELNGNVVEVTRQISQRGYVYDEAKDCLKGNCQGTEILLSINYQDVTTKNKIGQLIVEVPMAEKNAFDVVTNTFNVVYHIVSSDNGTKTYAVSNDGTQLVVSGTANGIRLTYNTPYYKK